jgi:hypothetical protein
MSVSLVTWIVLCPINSCTVRISTPAMTSRLANVRLAGPCNAYRVRSDGEMLGDLLPEPIDQTLLHVVVNSSGMPNTMIRLVRRADPNRWFSLRRCTASITNTMSAHSIRSADIGVSASGLVPADSTESPSSFENTTSAVGLRQRLRLQMNSRFIPGDRTGWWCAVLVGAFANLIG